MGRDTIRIGGACAFWGDSNDGVMQLVRRGEAVTIRIVSGSLVITASGRALNGGGQNQSRCILTGALVGAQAGLGGIPRRFIDGLENSADLLALAQSLGDQAAAV